MSELTKLQKIIGLLNRVDRFLPAVAITADIIKLLVDAAFTGDDVTDEFLATLGDESRTQEDRFAQILATAKANQAAAAELNEPGPGFVDDDTPTEEIELPPVDDPDDDPPATDALLPAA